MAEKIVSPGVFTRENDLSFLQEGVGAIGAAVIGPFKEGPAFVPQIINTQSEFERKFGRVDGTYYTGLTVQNYLREAGTVTIVRIGGIGGYTQEQPVAILASGSNGEDVIASWFDTDADADGAAVADYTASFGSGSTQDEIYFNLSGTAYTASITPSDPRDIGAVLGTDPQGSKAVYNYTYFENRASEISGDSYTLSLIQLPTQDFSEDITNATTPWVESNTNDNLFRFHTLSDGTITNRRYKVAISNIRPPQVSSGTDFATFNVTIREFDDTDRRPVVLETYTNVTCDPASPNFIARVIGDRTISIDDEGKITERGDWVNQSDYIRVEMTSANISPGGSTPLAHEAYYNPIKLNTPSQFPSVIYSTGSAENDAGVDANFSGIDLESQDARIDNYQYLKPLPADPEVGSNVRFDLETYVGPVSGSGNTTLFADLIESNDPDLRSEARNRAQFVLGFQGGFDGMSPTIENAKGTDITATNSQGFDLQNSTATGTQGYLKAIAAISNADEWDINLVSAPGVIRRLHPYVFDQFVDLVDTRQDAFFIGDVVGADDTISQAISQAESLDTSYAGTYYPWVKTVDNRTNRQITVPPSTLLPAIYAANDRIAAEWFAPAGLNRGGIVGAVGVENRLTRQDRDDLYEAKVNPIATFPGQGIVAWGQKTLQEQQSALDRINVRRLLIVAKKFIASTSRFLVFEQNTATTRNRFLNTVNPFFESIQQRQGLFAFRVQMDEDNNPPDVVDRNQLVGSIFIQPTRTAEFIIVDFNVLPTGATFTA